MTRKLIATSDQVSPDSLDHRQRRPLHLAAQGGYIKALALFLGLSHGESCLTEHGTM